PVRDDDADVRRMTHRGGSGRWQAAFAALGAVVLGALSWVVFSADTHSTTTTTNAATNNGTPSKPPSLGPNVPPPNVPNTPPPISTAVAPPTAAAPGPQAIASASDLTRIHSDATEDAKLATGERPKRTPKDKDKEKDKDRDKDKTADPAAKPSKGGATARVKVFPWGRVWVDGKLQGSVPPILEVNLTPGNHEIAVGHERPMESRSVSLQPGTTLVSFDLEGR
ncbi:MAG TPA: hypothetical protein VJV78_10065, partial [Polyangiales bacterium]|nr:hypothetical protein [Polyangiales bacterium]